MTQSQTIHNPVLIGRVPSNIAEIRGRYPLDEATENALLQNGFVTLDGVTQSDLSSAYPHHGADPHLFVTTDAMLTLWYGLHRRALVGAERTGFVGQLDQIVPALAHSVIELHTGEDDPEARAALHQAGLLVSVAAVLLDEGFRPAAVLKADCDTIVGKVLAHRVMEPYPDEDFTQYAVRGHYADAPELARYFRASLWLSRQFLSVDSVPVADCDGPLKTAIALAAALRKTPTATARLAALNAARVSLAGVANAISCGQLLRALDDYLEAGWALADALRPDALAALRRELADDAYPRAVVQTRSFWPGSPFPDRIISLLPDSATPDGLLFQATVNPAILGRSLPTGLQVGAALGFEEARIEIRRTDPFADAVLASSGGHPLPVPDDGTIYGHWLRALATLSTVDPRAPAFMQGTAWEALKLNTALAGWAQLRHNFILYAAQSYAMLMGITEVPPALVEPNPVFFQVLADLAGRMREVLNAADALPPAENEAFDLFMQKCRMFSIYAEAQLTGTLTSEQAQDIGQFGAWLERFELKTGPTVADVATGFEGEVLHVATGGLNPLVVIPAPETGVAYVGWVASYYEFVRPAGDRLTDDRWREIVSNGLLRPARPSWTDHFLSLEAGPAWEARAPLRDAERLIQEGFEEEAVALWRDLASRLETGLAVEAQCRLGDYFEARGDEGAALVEYLRCRRLRGGVASALARRRVTEIMGRRSIADRADVRTAEARHDEADQLLGTLEDAGTDQGVRDDLERRLVELLVKMFVDSHTRWHLQGIGDDDLERALRVCRTPMVQDTLGYVALLERRNRNRYGDDDNGAGGVSPEALRAASLAYASATGNDRLRGAAYAIAVDTGHMNGQPIEAARLLRPFLLAAQGDDEEDEEPEATSATDHTDAVEILRMAAGRHGFRFDLNPDDILTSTASTLRDDGVAHFYHEGRFEEMLELDRLLAGDSGLVTGSHEYVQRYHAYPEFDREPLRLYARAEGKEQVAPSSSAQDFVRLGREFPESRLVLPALRKAEALMRGTGDTTGAAGVRADVMRLFPEAGPASSFHVREALDRGDIAEAEQWQRRAESGPGTRGREDADTALGLYPDHSLGYEIEQQVKLRAVLGPFAEAAGWPIQRLLEAKDPLALADSLAAALPGRERNIFEACLKLNPHGGSDLCLRLLVWFPDDPAAEGWWNQGSGYDGRGLSRGGLGETLIWLVPLIERGINYHCSEQAMNAFAGLLGTRALTADTKWARDSSHIAVAENCRFVRDTYPGTRAAFLAAALAARARLEAGCPEDALADIQEALNGLGTDRPSLEEVERLERRARREVWAKGRPEWLPLWSTRVGSPEDVTTEGDRHIAAPLLTAGLLVVPTVIGVGWPRRPGRDNWGGAMGDDRYRTGTGYGRLAGRETLLCHLCGNRD